MSQWDEPPEFSGANSSDAAPDDNADGGAPADDDPAVTPLVVSWPSDDGETQTKTGKGAVAQAAGEVHVAEDGAVDSTPPDEAPVVTPRCVPVVTPLDGSAATPLPSTSKGCTSESGGGQEVEQLAASELHEAADDVVDGTTADDVPVVTPLDVPGAALLASTSHEGDSGSGGEEQVEQQAASEVPEAADDAVGGLPADEAPVATPLDATGSTTLASTRNAGDSESCAETDVERDVREVADDVADGTPVDEAPVDTPQDVPVVTRLTSASSASVTKRGKGNEAAEQATSDTRAAKVPDVAAGRRRGKRRRLDQSGRDEQCTHSPPSSSSAQGAFKPQMLESALRKLADMQASRVPHAAHVQVDSERGRPIVGHPQTPQFSPPKLLPAPATMQCAETRDAEPRDEAEVGPLSPSAAGADVLDAEVRDGRARREKGHPEPHSRYREWAVSDMLNDKVPDVADAHAEGERTHLAAPVSNVPDAKVPDVADVHAEAEREDQRLPAIVAHEAEQTDADYVHPEARDVHPQRPSSDVQHVSKMQLSFLVQAEKEVEQPPTSSMQPIPKPQIVFQVRPDNLSEPFTPPNFGARLRAHCKNSSHPMKAQMKVVLRDMAMSAEDVKKVVLGEGGRRQYHHRDIWVDTADKLRAMASTLKDSALVAVALMQHTQRSFMGFTCVLAFSTRCAHWLVDAMALRADIHAALAPLFLDADVGKVAAGGKALVPALERDFGIYLVNFMDLSEGAEALFDERLGLPELLETYGDATLTQQQMDHFEARDWRIRPLPGDLMSYAPNATCHLLQIYDGMLWDLCNRDKLVEAYSRSARVARIRHVRPKFQPSAAITTAMQRNFSDRQLNVLYAVLKWRFYKARQDDESLDYVLSFDNAFAIAQHVAVDMRTLCAALNVDDGHHLPPYLTENAHLLLDVVLRARSGSLKWRHKISNLRRSNSARLGKQLNAYNLRRSNSGTAFCMELISTKLHEGGNRKPGKP